MLSRLIAFVYPNSKNTATGRRGKTLRNGVLTSYGRTFFQLTSSNMVYPGYPQFNRLYLRTHVRINVPEKRRILVYKHIFELMSPKTYESRLIACSVRMYLYWTWYRIQGRFLTIDCPSSKKQLSGL